MNIILSSLIITFIILFALIFALKKFGTSENAVTTSYGNNVLDVIKNQQNWSYYVNNSLVSPYVFQIGTGTIQVSYYDSLGGYITGIVTFVTNYTVVDINTIQLAPKTLVSTATGRWPTNTWTLTYLSSQNLKLNDGTKDMSLVI